MTDLSVPAPDQAADLAKLLSETAEESRSAEQSEEILFPDDLLPGTREEHTSLLAGVRKYGVKTFAVLAIIVALDNLQSSGLAVLAPNIRSSFHVSSGVIVFVAGVSGDRKSVV